MSIKNQQSGSLSRALSQAVLKILRPLVRMLLRHGMSYGTFAELARWVFVDVASEDFTMPGRKQSASRVSVLTGLNRKEVSRLQSQAFFEDEKLAQQYNRAARVISGWLRDDEFTDAKQQPRALAMDGVTGSFAALVRRYSGDMPARAVLDELLRVKAVQKNSADEIELVTHGYIPAQGNEEKLHLLGMDVALLIQTIEHNIDNSNEKPFYQRKVAYNNLPASILPALRKLSAERAQDLLEELDRYLVKHDRDTTQQPSDDTRMHAGLAIYYFEEEYKENTHEQA